MRRLLPYDPPADSPIGLIPYIICKYFLANQEYIDDMVYWGYLGLRRAQENYNGNGSFSTYACICIRNSIISRLDSEYKRNRIGGYSKLGIDAVDVVQEPVDFDSPLDRRVHEEPFQFYGNDLKRALSALTKEEQQYVMLFFCDGLSHREICDIMGKKKSKYYESEYMRKMLNKMRSALENA